jgi:flagellar biosynthesis regulator FlaF
MAAWLLTASGAGSASQIYIAIEVPHGPVVETLIERGFMVHAINPKQMDRFRDRFTLAGAKDDSRDAEVMASSVRTDPRCFRLLAALDPTVIELREWSRITSDLGTERNRLTNRLRAQLWRYCAQVARSAIAQQKNFPPCWSLKVILAPSGCSICGRSRQRPVRLRAFAKELLLRY